MNDNQLIAKYMGWPVCNDDTIVYNNTNHSKILKLDSEPEWNWLIPVTEKIKHHDHICVVECVFYNIGCDFIIEAYNDELYSFIATRKDHKDEISMVYSAILKFIKWYNNGDLQ